MLDICRNQCRHASSLMGIARAHGVANLLDWRALLEHAPGLNRFADTNLASAAMTIAITVEKALVALVLVATAIAMKLRNQRRVVTRDLIGLSHRPGEKRGVKRNRMLAARCRIHRSLVGRSSLVGANAEVQADRNHHATDDQQDFTSGALPHNLTS